MGKKFPFSSIEIGVSSSLIILFFIHNLKSSSPYEGAICTIPVPESLVTNSPNKTLKHPYSFLLM